MIYYCLKQNQNKQFPLAYLKWYAKPVQGETYDLQGLANHMSNHHTIYSPSVILGVMTEMVDCIRELLLQGNQVRIDNLCIFSVGIVNKKGCEDKSEYKVSEYVEGVKMKVRPVGDFTRAQLNLDATLKRSALDKDDASSTDGTGGTSGGGGSSSEDDEDEELKNVLG
jgi:predicted histone-like DNA-binding protein